MYFYACGSYSFLSDISGYAKGYSEAEDRSVAWDLHCRLHVSYIRVHTAYLTTLLIPSTSIHCLLGYQFHELQPLFNSSSIL